MNPTLALTNMLPATFSPRWWAGVGTLLLAMSAGAYEKGLEFHEGEQWVGNLTLSSTNEKAYSQIPICRKGNSCYRTLCGVDLSEEVGDEVWIVVGTANVTSTDIRRRKLSAGFTVETHVCALGECRRIGQSGGRNVSPAMHHDALQRVTMLVPAPGDDEVRLVARAYNLKALRSDDLRIDGCSLQVLRVPG